MRTAAIGAVVLTASLGAAAACGGSEKEAPKTGAANRPGDQTSGPDRSRCEWQGRTDREVLESRGPGALTPNVRRAYGVIGEGEDRRRLLLCREVDTNLDGFKDVVRRYNEKGDAIEEQADTNHDGNIDTWIRFAQGRIAKVEIDNNGDGRPDETRYYIKGVLSRVQRDTNQDGKPDIWEIYSDGRLERMGVDVDHDGHVDRWDRDEVARRLTDIREREEEERREREQARKSGEERDGGATGAYVSPRKR